jgi:hypothetical protein
MGVAIRSPGPFTSQKQFIQWNAHCRRLYVRRWVLN